MSDTELPADIERQLKSLESRHARHQNMIEGHRQAKALRRDRHRARWHKFKVIPIILI
jgi:hypothetical protein